MTKINIVRNVLEANDALAGENRDRMGRAGCLAVNITSAPGSGKTTLLERTIPALVDRGLRSAVIVGDLQTSRDAERLGELAAEIVQINTEGGCHLSAAQVAGGLASLQLKDLAFIFIENVGNMVCPAGFDLGEHKRVAMLSTPEGPDKVAKYPTLFQPADVILLNKMDLAEPLGFETALMYEDLRQINSAAAVLEISARTADGLEPWLDWLVGQRQDRIG
jgi:hydrogenase nickel incorporation protein HypB